MCLTRSNSEELLCKKSQVDIVASFYFALLHSGIFQDYKTCINSFNVSFGLRIQKAGVLDRLSRVWWWFSLQQHRLIIFLIQCMLAVFSPLCSASENVDNRNHNNL